MDAKGQFEGTKQVVFTTSNLIGGRNTTMFLAFLTLSLLLLFAMILTLIVFKRNKKIRKLLTTHGSKSSDINSSLSDSENFFIENSTKKQANPKETLGI